jgi:hypothetical protein
MAMGTAGTVMTKAKGTASTDPREKSVPDDPFIDLVPGTPSSVPDRPHSQRVVSPVPEQTRGLLDVIGWLLIASGCLYPPERHLLSSLGQWEFRPGVEG